MESRCGETGLQTVVDYKMGVNRNRTWSRSPTGKIQHVDNPLSEGEPS